MTPVKRIRLVLAVLVTIATIALSPARADVLVSNLSVPFRSTTPIGNAHDMIEYWAAQSFFTDANTYTLTSIRAMLRDGMGAPLVVAELRAPDAATTGFTPDTTAAGLLATFTAPDVTGATSPRLFSPIGSVTLLPNTEYWFILGSMTGTYGWDYTENPTGLSTGPGSTSYFSDSSDSGGTWRNYGGSTSNPYFIEVNVLASAVPEPGSLTLMGIAVGLGLFGRAWRRQVV